MENEINPLKPQGIKKTEKNYKDLCRRKQQKLNGWVFNRKIDEHI